LTLPPRQHTADILQRGRHDLDVQQRHEAAEAHHDEWDDAFEPVFRSAVSHFTPPERVRVSTVAMVESPGRIMPRFESLSSSAIRTATRCTILVKLPVAFSGGMTLKTAPVAGARLRRRPWKTWPGRVSATMVADCPAFIRAS